MLYAPSIRAIILLQYIKLQQYFDAPVTVEYSLQNEIAASLFYI